jgi:hypothetical protein
MTTDNGNGGIAALLFIVAAGALAFFGWKKFQGLESKLEEKGTTGGGGTTDTAGAAQQSGKGIVYKRLKALAPARSGVAGAEEKKPDAKSVFANKFADKILIYAGNLQRADQEAGAFLVKLGTTPFINTTLTTINALPDADFTQAYKAWKAMGTFGNVYSTNLFKANVDNYGISDFFSRIYKLNIA